MSASIPLLPQVLITLVLLISFLQPATFAFGDQWDVVDLFAGHGRIARLARQSGQRSVALDLLYSNNAHSFDINEDAGLLLLNLNMNGQFYSSTVGGSHQFVFYGWLHI